jgi:hypothetical protein
MSRMIRRGSSLVAILGLVLVATAVAGYQSGSYSGTTAQINPTTSKRFTIKFNISGGTIKNVVTITRDRCPDGSHVRVNQNAFKTATIDKKGNFVLRAGTRLQPSVLKGQVSGSSASGTLSDKTLDPAGSGLCRASTTWTASKPRRKK